jgi:hypothetical protein
MLCLPIWYVTPAEFAQLGLGRLLAKHLDVANSDA